MISGKQSHSKFKPLIAFAGLILLTGATTAGSGQKEIVLKVVGPNSKTLKDAVIYQQYSMQNYLLTGTEYACDKNGIVHLTEEKIFEYDWQRKRGVVLYGLYENKLAGFKDVNTSDIGKELEMKLTPACRVYGKITSKDLETLGLELEFRNVGIWRDNKRLLSYMGYDEDFEFLLPSGKYQLGVDAAKTYDKLESFEVEPEKKELELNFDLPAYRLAHLIGKEAPELQQIKGWINSKPLKLADLRGKVILLDFWGTWCGPCIVEIQQLIRLHEKYQDKGLVIIGIHDDSMKSIADLKKEIKKLSKEHWKGKTIPFAVALDGGGDCKIEGIQHTTRGATTATYGINSFPTMVLIDKQGRVVKQYDPDRDTKMLKKLLTTDIDNRP